MIYLPELALNQPTHFPPLSEALTEPDGLLALGGDLSVPRLLAAYQQGIFPWFSDNEPYLWWSPSERAVIYLDAFHASRSLRRFTKQQVFRLTLNQAFSEVITHCALLRGEDKVWITQEMRAAYLQLHHAGHAHSIELWQDEQLIGGMYGVAVGALFCGESMFSLRTNASKIVLWQFSHYFKTMGGKLLDCQMMTTHLATLGAKAMPRATYIQQLENLKNMALPADTFSPQEIALVMT